MVTNFFLRGDSMKQKSLLLILGVCLLVLMLGQVAFAEKEPTVGLNIGNVAFSAPVTPEDATYLGLAGQKDFTLSDIKAPYVLIESMNTT
jgi:hypothetical protein